MRNSNRQARRAWAALHRKHSKCGNLLFIEVQHDDWCSIFSPLKRCNCNPLRILKDDQNRELGRIGGAGAYSVAEFFGGGDD